ncbi:hypothetical protein [Zooshikella ganghwensis]|uniref:hypothetical protein n=1 Tax=Zooshikella ganghwensis TaxID=202772 RepID=UPI001058C60D|nr:hypothetical protein [Zooshikella ganghwensis]
MKRIKATFDPQLQYIQVEAVEIDSHLLRHARKKVLKACQQNNNYRLLVFLKEMGESVHQNAMDYYSFATSFFSEGFPQNTQIAIITTPTNYGAESVTRIAKDRRVNIKLFYEEQEAKKWLLGKT